MARHWFRACCICRLGRGFGMARRAKNLQRNLQGRHCVAKQGSPRKPLKRACQSENQKHPVNLQYNHHQYNHQTSSENFLPFIEEDTIWLWTIGMDFRFYRDYHIPSPIRQSGGKSIPYGLQVENQYFIGDIKRLV